MLDVCLLGTGGMMPLPNRYLTSLITRLDGRLLLIDCGEGTQVTMKTLGWGYKNIDIICFTHYHADHIAGLPGLLLTIATSNRTEPITLIGPPELEHIVKSLCVIATEIPFELRFIELPGSGSKEEIAVPNTDYFINALPVEHSKACFAYNICVKRGGKFDLKRAAALDLPRQYWSYLQKGETVEYNGKAFTPDMVLGGARAGIKVSYCTDSRPVKTLPDFIRGADLFICEGLYGDAEKQPKAADHRHMVYAEAAELARLGEVKKLWLTHFSPAMVDPYEHLQDARQIFPAAFAGRDRMAETIYFTES